MLGQGNSDGGEASDGPAVEEFELRQLPDHERRSRVDVEGMRTREARRRSRKDGRLPKLNDKGVKLDRRWQKR